MQTTHTFGRRQYILYYNAENAANQATRPRSPGESEKFKIDPSEPRCAFGAFAT
jgi:hypothetical protein